MARRVRRLSLGAILFPNLGYFRLPRRSLGCAAVAEESPFGSIARLFSRSLIVQSLQSTCAYVRLTLPLCIGPRLG